MFLYLFHKILIQDMASNMLRLSLSRFFKEILLFFIFFA
jgi:hypothetical protein